MPMSDPRISGESSLRNPVYLLLPLLAGCMSDEPLQQPTPLFDAPPFEYPVELWERGVEGETVLMIHISSIGEVDSAYVHRSSGYAQFDSAAVAAAHQLRFTPGRRGEKRIGLWAKLPVMFTRDGADTGGVRVVPPDPLPPDFHEPAIRRSEPLPK